MKFADVARRWLDWDDEELLDILVAAAVAIDLPGDPVWGLVLKPSGGGGTELLRAFQGVRVKHLSTLTRQTLISGLNEKGKTKARGGVDLLPELDGKLLVLKDFTSILEMRDADRSRVLADLREAYDGSLAKAFGSGVGTKEYHSSFGLLAACVTHVAERNRTAMAMLGERYFWVRYEPDRDKAEAQAWVNSEHEDEMRKELASALSSCWEQACDWLQLVEDPEHIRTTITALAGLAALLRTPAEREYGLISVIPDPEVGTRLVKVFRKLARCIAAVRSVSVPGEAEAGAIRRIARDTIPQLRLEIVMAVQYSNAPLGLTANDIARVIDRPPRTVANEVESLQSLRAITRDRAGRVALSERVVQLLGLAGLMERTTI